MVSTGLSEGSKDQIVFNVLKMIVRPFIGLRVEDGALNQLWAATGKGVESGTYYVPVGKKHPGSADSRDMALAAKLWEWSEKELEKYSL